jgi:hypothetical protein
MKRQRGRGRKPTSNGHSNNHNQNRSFDSNGPGIKIRGAAAHVYEKYAQLARDELSSGDRVQAENYLQHAEHYFRIMQSQQAAQRERDERFRDRNDNRNDRDEDDGDHAHDVSADQDQDGEDNDDDHSQADLVRSEGVERSDRGELRGEQRGRRRQRGRRDGSMTASTSERPNPELEVIGTPDEVVTQAASPVVEEAEAKPRRAPRRRVAPASQDADTADSAAAEA